MLQILSDEDGLLGESRIKCLWHIGKTLIEFIEVFLPFELEFAFGAAIHLVMARTLFPHVTDGEACSNHAHSILNEMISKGNKLAEVRKSELAHIESLFRELSTQVERRGLQALTLPSPELIDAVCQAQQMPSVASPQSMTVPATEDSQCPLSSPLSQEAMNFDLLDNIGISSYDFFSIVDQMENQDVFGILDSDQYWNE